MAREIAFEYKSTKGHLHKVHPFIKLAGMGALSIYALGAPTVGLLAISLSLVILSIFGRIDPRKLLTGSGPMLITTFAFVLFGAFELSPIGFNRDALFSGFRFLWAIGISFASASIFFYSTKISDLRDALEGFENFFGPIKHPYLRFSLLFSLTLSFIPRVFSEWAEAEEAWYGRGGKRGAEMLIRLIPPVMERLILAAKETAHALELRIGR